MTACRFLEPLDLLFLRGNKLFGDPGSYGESLVPPWPSVAAGAIRSQMLAADGADLAAFARGEQPHPVLGTPDDPGGFMVSGFHLAHRIGDRIETLHPLPADLVAMKVGDEIELRRLRPAMPATGIEGSHPLGRWPMLAADRQAKPVGDAWLTEAGWRRYLAGEVPDSNQIRGSESLWKFDPRVGVGLDPEKRSADDGKLFTVQAVALEAGIGFLATIEGADPPTSGTLRLGGDGRASTVAAVDHEPATPDYAALCSAGCCRIVLTSPGLFVDGWMPPGCDADGRFELTGIRARLASAAVPRTETVSGWDLANWRPKTAQRAAPAGSVYWLDELEATPERLRKLATHGLWPASGYDAQRRAEGFNRFTFATY